MNYERDQQQSNQIEDNASFDFLKTNYSGHFEKSFNFEASSFHHELFGGETLQYQEEFRNFKAFDKVENRKLQNKMNARRAREKRKGEYEDLKIRVQNLQNQNRQLRDSRTCRWCRRSLDPYSMHSVAVQTPNKLSEKENCSQKQFVFQQIKYVPEKKQWKSKLWIALGMLMLIIGIQFHGFSGSDDKSIKFNSAEINQWTNKFEQNSIEPFKIKMKTKATHNMQQQYNTNWGNKVREKRKWEDLIEFQPEEQFVIEEENEEVSEIRIDKDLLFSIQAQFDDIGRYI